ncbi:MAG: hypothetical protein ACI9CO_000109 [Candidatus Azotimanducaceae bacterium]|jgi:hypothetical protein
MTTDTQPCSVCGSAVHESPRYPGYLCQVCALKVMDANGVAIVYYNTTLSGSGCQGYYSYPDKLYSDEYCYVEGLKCIARDGYFGGIIVQPERFWDDTN